MNKKENYIQNHVRILNIQKYLKDLIVKIMKVQLQFYTKRRIINQNKIFHKIQLILFIILAIDLIINTLIKNMMMIV